MHFRRLVCVLLGAWIAGSVLVNYSASENLRSVERHLLQPSQPAAVVVRELGKDAGRLLLFQAAEQNRSLRGAWENAQLALGAAVLLILLFGTHERSITIIPAVLMLAIVIGMRLALTPQMASFGRATDFLADQVRSPARGHLVLFDRVYGILDTTKLVLAAFLAVKLVLSSRVFSRVSGLFGAKVDPVDVADYRHIDR